MSRDDYLSDLNLFNRGLEQGREEESYNYVHPMMPFVFGLILGGAITLMLLKYI